MRKLCFVCILLVGCSKGKIDDIYIGDWYARNGDCVEVLSIDKNGKGYWSMDGSATDCGDYNKGRFSSENGELRFNARLSIRYNETYTVNAAPHIINDTNVSLSTTLGTVRRKMTLTPHRISSYSYDFYAE
ncbi:MAG: hypothetical protein IH948_04380 [Bacteroidetes bacterium]|nr:hypothetical protein [Bacteroidota bacterium]